MGKMTISRAKWRVVGPVKSYDMRNCSVHRIQCTLGHDTGPASGIFDIYVFWGHFLGLGRQKVGEVKKIG